MLGGSEGDEETGGGGRVGKGEEKGGGRGGWESFIVSLTFHKPEERNCICCFGCKNYFFFTLLAEFSFVWLSFSCMYCLICFPASLQVYVVVFLALHVCNVRTCMGSDSKFCLSLGNFHFYSGCDVCTVQRLSGGGLYFPVFFY